MDLKNFGSCSSICSKKNDDETKMFFYSCGHSFHLRCIAEHFEDANRKGPGNRNCPDCTDILTSLIPIRISSKRLQILSLQSPINGQPLGGLTNTNTPSPEKSLWHPNEETKQCIREVEMTFDDGLVETEPGNSPEFVRIDGSPIIPIPASNTLLRSKRRSFFIDPDGANLSFESRLERWRDLVRRDPPIPIKKTGTKHQK